MRKRIYREEWAIVADKAAAESQSTCECLEKLCGLAEQYCPDTPWADLARELEQLDYEADTARAIEYISVCLKHMSQVSSDNVNGFAFIWPSLTYPESHEEDLEPAYIDMGWIAGLKPEADQEDDRGPLPPEGEEPQSWDSEVAVLIGHVQNTWFDNLDPECDDEIWLMSDDIHVEIAIRSAVRSLPLERWLGNQPYRYIYRGVTAYSELIGAVTQDGFVRYSSHPGTVTQDGFLRYNARDEGGMAAWCSELRSRYTGR